MRSITFVTSLSATFLATATVWGATPDVTPAAANDAQPAAQTPQKSDAARDQPPEPVQQEEATEKRHANNSLFVEGLGPGLLYSVNYDRTIGDFSARIGFSYMSFSASGTDATGTSGGSASASFLTVPITVSYLGVGSVRNMLELGAGATIISAGAGASGFNSESSSSATASTIMVQPIVMAGYRYQPENGGFFFKGGLSFLIGGSIIPVLPWPYVALGGTFGP